MTLEKPDYIADNPVMSAKWDEITDGRDFDKIHQTTIEELCFWYSVRRQCQEDITVDGEIRVAYQNDMGDVKALPQMSTAKQASDQIRQLNKQLGINDQAQKEENPNRKTPLYVIQDKRKSRAAHSRGAKAV